MAEAFSNKVTRAAGIVSTSSAGAVGILTNLITGISTVDVAVNDLVDSTQFILGTKVSSVGASQVCLLYTSPSPRDKRQSRMPSSA